MYVTYLDASNIRCFPELKLHFSPAINLLVGENNAGKSTVIACILNLQQQTFTDKSCRLRAAVSKLTLHLRDVSFGKLNDLQRKDAGSPFPSNSSIEINLRFTRNDGKYLERIIYPGNSHQHFYRFDATQPGNVVFPYLSHRKTHQYVESFSSLHAYQADGMLATLFSKITRICTSPQLRPSYEEACKAVLGFVVTPVPAEGGTHAGLEVDAVDQEFISLGHMGAGVANAVGFIVELLVARNHIFVVEELENDLHPSALRKLAALILKSASAGNQFFISTHSSVLMRELAVQDSCKIFEVEADLGSEIPTSRVNEVSNKPNERIRILRSLGYELADFEIADAWLLLEESSAETILKEFLIPWFAPELFSRVRTVSGAGADEASYRFASLERLILFLHLEAATKQHIWVFLDGDAAGLKAIERLRLGFKSWPTDRFRQFSKKDFELFYPARFQEAVAKIESLADKDQKSEAKAALLRDVVAFLRKDPAARSELFESAGEVIAVLEEIGKALSQ